MKASDWVGRWKGKTVACIASGPSLTAEDCEAVRAAGLPTIVTNNTFTLCPWADVLLGFDSAWWRAYGADAAREFGGEKLCCAPIGTGPGSIGAFGVESLHGRDWFRPHLNSGASALALAVAAGASRVLLLGFDCQRTGGRTHWHGDHQRGLSNARSIAKWPFRMKNVARLAAEKRVRVVNCSRATALDCFERGSLERELSPAREPAMA